MEGVEPDIKQDVLPVAIPVSPPSAFARTLFGLHSYASESIQSNSLPASFSLYPRVLTDAELATFTELSPDDVVVNAQNSRGPARGTTRR